MDYLLDNWPALWRGLRILLGLLLLGLPLMTAWCAWQTVRLREADRDALAGSYADAAKSFLGMTLSSWALIGLGFWAYQRVLVLIPDIRG